ncbi:metal-sensing transcriptional repressor [Adlercreutzia equolifaciens]|jgi:DNA-binding FrmR family transcriptional regulator|uniref:Metal-sensing transcriptional repressor n=2 Tax=Adlercreutzia TaxID=447020 RepID=A0A3E2EHV2_9ACTN|nr:metal-sensing transcriptional repressor [Adlercreutzia rubneri]RFT81564.1 metal-sensitive transcriptional repressor [Adlercreutzia equolifaciens]
MPKAGAAQAAAKTGAGRTGHVPDCPCRHKNTPRSTELQADMQKRLNRAIGQLTGVKAMIEDNRYCGDVLTQLAAAEAAVRRVSEMVLAEHMRTCVVEEVRAGNDEVIDEVMALMSRFSK